MAGDDGHKCLTLCGRTLCGPPKRNPREGEAITSAEQEPVSLWNICDFALYLSQDPPQRTQDPSNPTSKHYVTIEMIQAPVATVTIL